MDFPHIRITIQNIAESTCIVVQNMMTGYVYIYDLCKADDWKLMNNDEQNQLFTENHMFAVKKMIEDEEISDQMEELNIGR